MQLKHLVLILAVAAIAALLMFSPAALMAQTAAYTGYPYISLNAATSAGTGTAYSVQPQIYSYTWSLAASGTVSACTVNLEGSLDGSTGYVLDQAAATDTGWSAGEMRHVVNKQVTYLRLNLISITGGGSITGKIALFH